ncbi:thioredoxin reductase [Cupriavidus basilensis OR16]|uniref:Thioredoxin reductase n=1 Tax=Cupriavidus basilensis OR16 TaxID=1127483 RepID=H1SHC9_9BURK|nr:FAD-dependent oxidoreductase [Cupriavidus basilensis]EHP38120.1 thioredoxin reductase [Cupriavidus basilensis OR16]
MSADNAIGSLETPGPQAVVAAGLAIEQEAATAAFSPMESRRHQMWPLLTAAEIARVQHFGTLQRWRANEYLFRTGDPAHGMAVVLQGRVRVMQRDARDRASVVGEHGPGSFLAEVGQLSGKPALVDGLALEDVEAISIPPDRLRALMVAEAELGERIMRALILRRVGLIERGNGPTLLGRSSDAHLLHLQAFLRRNGYPHTVVDADTDPDACALLEFSAAGPGDFPLVICPGGAVLRRPDAGQLATCLGLLPDFDPDYVYDVIVVGAGPAGLATAVYAASEGLCVAVFDSLAPGGQAGASSRIENYLGFPTGISGQALAGRAFVQAQKFGAHLAIPLQVTALHCGEHPQRVELSDGRRISARTVVIASGAAYRHPAIAALDRYEGRGVYYWASPVEARLCSGEEVMLVGGGNSAGQAAVFLAAHAKRVHILIRASGLEASMSRYLIERIAAQPNIELHTGSEIVALGGEERLATIGYRTRDSDRVTEVQIRHLFLFTGADPNTGWLASCNVRVDAKGFVLTGTDTAHEGTMPASALETSVPGIFAIGDVRSGSTKRVAAAVGEGAAVVAQIHGYLAKMQQPEPGTLAM